MFKHALIAALSFPAAAFAVGLDDSDPPKPTETTQTCTDGTIWDESSKSCVLIKDSRLDDDTRYRAAREFAYAGAYDHALQTLAAMSDQNDDRVLTYLGFTNRKLGNAELAHRLYQKALATNPDNLLARSYMGQGYAEAGHVDLAWRQLKEIRARGGAGTWAETALIHAIQTGSGYNY